MATSTATLRSWWSDAAPNYKLVPHAQVECDWSMTTKVGFPTTLTSTAFSYDARGWILLSVHGAAKEAFVAAATVMAALGVQIRSSASGTLNCRCIRNDCTNYGTSLHAHAIALDILPAPGSRFGDAIEAIRTHRDDQVFNWLGPTFDPMHIQINTSKAGLASGIDWTTVEGAMSEFIVTNDIIDVDTKKWWQRVFTAIGYPIGTIDGVLGTKWSESVALLQINLGLPQTGVLDTISQHELLRSYARSINVGLYAAKVHDHDDDHGHPTTDAAVVELANKVDTLESDVANSLDAGDVREIIAASIANG